MAITVEPHKSSLGMEANVAILIAYLGSIIIGWVPFIGYGAFLIPLIIFLVEKESGFVRFHAMQSFLLSILSYVLKIAMSIIQLIFSPVLSDIATLPSMMTAGVVIGILGTLFSIAILVLAIIALINGYQYKKYRLPLLGNLAARLSDR